MQNVLPTADEEQIVTYGDSDGSGSSARLMRPTGACRFQPGALLVADTLNNKVWSYFLIQALTITDDVPLLAL